MRLVLLLLLIAMPALSSAQAARPAKLGLCVACHGEQGISRVPGVPSLAGQDEVYLKKALGDYRSGVRNVAPMSSLANTLQPRDIDALAHWFSSQPGFGKKAP
jgi:cytochrome c553